MHPSSELITSDEKERLKFDIYKNSPPSRWRDNAPG